MCKVRPRRSHYESLQGSRRFLSRQHRAAPPAILAKENIKKVEVLEYPELGMEAVWRIEVGNFPAFILVDDKGNDFFVNTCGICVPG